MNITQLEYLRELYATGSFSAAAERLGITQPALSLQVQKLEEELEFKLIDRSKRPFAFTGEGQLFYEKSVDILQQMEQLRHIALELSGEVQGTLKVGIIPTLGPYLVPMVMHPLSSAYPALQLEVFEQATGEIIAGIKSGGLDCGIFSTPVSAGNMVFRTLFYERFFAYVSEIHPLFSRAKLRVEDIDESALWYLNEGNCFQHQVDAICQINPRHREGRNLVYHSNSIESLRRIVEKKNGITFIPELATVQIPAEQEELIREFSGHPPSREISLVCARGFTKERQVDALEQVIKENIPRRMQTKPDHWIVDPMV